INSESLVKSGSISPEQTSFIKNVGKNLFDGRYYNNYTILTNPAEGVGDVSYVVHNPSNASISVLMTLDDNKTYTVTKYAGGNRFNAALLKELPNPYKTSVNSIANRYVGSATGRVSWTFDNSEHHAAYLLVVVGVGTNEKPNVQLEEGNGSSDYEEPKFKFDGVVELDYVTNMGEGVVGYKNTNFITHGKNLFDRFHRSYTIYTATPIGDGNVSYVSPNSSTERYTAVVELKKNTEYTVTKYQGGNRFNLVTVDELPTPGKPKWSIYNFYGERNSSEQSHTFFNEEAKYLIVQCGLNPPSLPNVQVEEGERTSYEEFHYVFDRPIKIKNNESKSNFGVQDYFSLQGGLINTFEGGSSTQTEDIISAYDTLADEFPNYITKEFLGDTTDDTKMYAYKFKPEIYEVRSGDIEFDIPRVVISTGTHGSEKGPIFYTWNLMNLICNHWKSDGVLEYLRHNVEFYIIPTVNPTGVNYHTRTNVNEVDLNRDFPRGIDDNEDYSDRELETQILIDIMKNQKDDIDLWIDYHAKNWDDYYFYVTGRNKLVNKTGAETMALVGRKFSLKHEFLPQDDEYVYGYNSLGVQNTVTDCNNATGIPAMTLEVVEALKWEPGYSRNNMLAYELGVEYIVNTVRKNLIHINA